MIISKHTELFDFLSELIDVQIKKYLKLAIIGVGPDAWPNAAIVCDEVAELLVFAAELLKDLERKNASDEVFLRLFHQIVFYVQQERIRGYTGWSLTL